MVDRWMDWESDGDCTVRRRRRRRGYERVRDGETAWTDKRTNEQTDTETGEKKAESEGNNATRRSDEHTSVLQRQRVKGSNIAHARSPTHKVPTNKQTKRKLNHTSPSPSPMRRKRAQHQPLRKLLFPRHALHRLRKIDPLSSPLLALQPVRIEPGHVQLVEVVCRGGGGDGGYVARDGAADAGCRGWVDGLTEDGG